MHHYIKVLVIDQNSPVTTLSGFWGILHSYSQCIDLRLVMHNKFFFSSLGNCSWYSVTHNFYKIQPWSLVSPLSSFDGHQSTKYSILKQNLNLICVCIYYYKTSSIDSISKESVTTVQVTIVTSFTWTTGDVDGRLQWYE